MTLADEVLAAKTCDQAPNESGKAKGTDAEDVGPKEPWCFGDIDFTNQLVCCRQPIFRNAPSAIVSRPVPPTMLAAKLPRFIAIFLAWLDILTMTRCAAKTLLRQR